MVGSMTFVLVLRGFNLMSVIRELFKTRRQNASGMWLVASNLRPAPRMLRECAGLSSVHAQQHGTISGPDLQCLDCGNGPRFLALSKGQSRLASLRA
jgi:hypothetical protein